MDDSHILVGSIITIAANQVATLPSRWKVCDGVALKRKKYPELFDFIKCKYGAGDGVTTFNIPTCKEPHGNILMIMKVSMTNDTDSHCFFCKKEIPDTRDPFDFDVGLECDECSTKMNWFVIGLIVGFIMACLVLHSL